jgi:transposase
MKRNRHSKEFKARLALEAIKGQKSAAELASEYEVHVSQINTSKKQALAALPEVFGRSEARAEAQR